MNNQINLKLCFGTYCSFLPGTEPSSYERQYQTIFKPLISSLYTLEQVPFTLAFSGYFFEWIESHHPEFIMILEEMVGRKQIDIVGGGYWTPLFPVIPPADRVGQIELLTTLLRKTAGKRPRGLWLPASAWESSMVASLCTCGMEYVLIDKIMLESSGCAMVDGYSPAVIEDCGKTVIAVPVDNRYRFPNHFSPESYFEDISSSVEEGQERLLVILFETAALASIFSADSGRESWFERFIDLFQHNKNAIELSSPSRVLKNRVLWPRVYLSSGMSPFALEDIRTTDLAAVLSRTSIKHTFIKSPAVMNLYAKMMYVHVLVNQLRGDKARKKNAREELWQAQCGDVYRTATSGNSRKVRSMRTAAYRHLLAAERLARLKGVFFPSIVSFDFDMDGLKEFLCQLDDINMYVHQRGGKIFIFDVFKSHRNYCHFTDLRQGLFVDHLITQEELSRLEAGIFPDTNKPVFADELYQETNIDSPRHEIHLKANGFFGAFQQPVSLRKSFNFRNEGLQLQYIIKNESPLTLSGIFVTEADFAISDLKNKAPQMESYSGENRQEGPVVRSMFRDVSWLRIDDAETSIRFTLEANENPSVSVIPLYCDPDPEEETGQKISGVRIFLYWKVDLTPGFETEKTIFLKTET